MNTPPHHVFLAPLALLRRVFARIGARPANAESFRNITRRKQAEEILRENEERFRATFEQAAVGMAHIGLDGRFLLVNQKLCEILGYQREELLARTFQELTHPEDLPTNVIYNQQLCAGEIQTFSMEKRYIRSDGAPVWADLTVSLVRTADGNPKYFVSVIQDISKRKQAETILRDNQQMLARAESVARLGSFEWSITDNRLRWSDEMRRIYGLSPEEAPQDFESFLARLHPEDRAHIRSTVEDALHNCRPFEMEERIVRPDGSLRVLITKGEIQTDATGQPLRIVGICRDITDQKQAEEGLRRSQNLLANAEALAQAGSFEWNLTDNGFACSDQLYRIFGLPADTADVSAETFLARIHPDDQSQVRKIIEQAVAQVAPFELETRIVRPDGTIRILTNRSETQAGPDGQAVRLIGVSQDITERRQAETALRDREEQLQQAQKMEAIGRLAGGIAHDFNNLLTAINGYSSLLLKKLEAGSAARKDLEEIRKAGDRAAALTHQLLAFSRRQLIRPRVLDLNHVVTGIDRMLRRLIGEDIELITRLAPTPCLVRADQGQLEQVLMNIAINARDAMPVGGTLTIETGQVTADDEFLRHQFDRQHDRYVTIAIRDTGCGMDAVTQEHIFEPFFTTKEQGKGTGLGLSTAYGIVTQAEGYIQVQSAPGEGTTFIIFLPLIQEEAEQFVSGEELSESPSGSETILLAEDEDMVRNLVRNLLTSGGYQVLEARTGAEAIQLCAAYRGPIHLLLTDLVMPQMSGRELAEQLLPLHPEMKVLMMSGYTDDKLITHGLSSTYHMLLQKPFTPGLLLGRVRETLDRAQPGAKA